MDNVSFANCSREVSIEVRTLAGLRGSASAVALLLTVGLLMITYYCGVARGKKWVKVSLYVLYGSSISYLVVLYISVFHILYPSSWISVWCKVFGFFDQVLSVLLISMLLVNIHPTVTILLSHINHGHDEVMGCKKNKIVRVFLGVVVLVTFLMIISSIAPFITDTYGPVGGWCWITVKDKCKHVSVGLLEQMLLWYIFYTIISLICIILMLMAVSIFVKEVCRNYNHKAHQQHPNQNTHQYKKHCTVFGKVVIQLIVLVPILIDFIIFGLRASGNYSPLVWVIFAVGPPTIGFLIPLSIMLYIQYRPDEPNATPSGAERHNLNSQANFNKSYGALQGEKTTEAVFSTTSDYHTARDEFSSFEHVD